MFISLFIWKKNKFSRTFYVSAFFSKKNLHPAFPFQKFIFSDLASTMELASFCPAPKKKKTDGEWIFLFFHFYWTKNKFSRTFYVFTSFWSK